MIEMLPAESKKLLLAADAANGMKELGIDPLTDEIRVFLDLLDSLGLGNRRIADRLIEVVDIG